MGPQTSPNDVVGWNSDHFHMFGWRNGSTDISKWFCGLKLWPFPHVWMKNGSIDMSKWCCGVKPWLFLHVWMKKWVNRYLQIMLWGETLAISTCMDEEMGLQTSPNDVVGWNSGNFHISGCRNGFTDIFKWCCGIKLWPFPLSATPCPRWCARIC